MLSALDISKLMMIARASVCVREKYRGETESHMTVQFIALSCVDGAEQPDFCSCFIASASTLIRWEQGREERGERDKEDGTS